MKFLCGRPGCGKESAATLQIDAPSTTVSLVDPRISRDGVPLCARHADSTTPPMGWTMNDLRSRSRGLAAVPDETVAAPTSTPPRDRRESEDSYGRRMSRRQSIAERAKQAAANGAAGEPVIEQAEDDPMFNSSRPVKGRQAAEAQENDDDANAPAANGSGGKRSGGKRSGKKRSNNQRSNNNGSGGNGSGSEQRNRSGKQEDPDGPASRPNRRRQVAASAENGEEAEDGFPWHHQYDDEEPEELQASSPLLSRAFRATTG